MSLRPPFARRPWLALLLLSPSLALAAEKTATQFDTVTVTATRSEQTLDQVPNTVSVMTEREIDQKNVKNIQDLVRYEPGVTVSGAGSRFGLSGFTIRGLGGNRVLTQVDGVSVPDAFDFGPFLNARRNYVDMDTVKQVEIIRGPASSLYGSDAISGAVSFITKDAADYLDEGNDTYARLKTGYDGSDDSWMRSATFAARQGSVDGVLHIGRRDGQAVDTYGGRSGIGAGREEANPQDYTAENLLAKVGWNYNDTDRLQLTYDRYADDADTKVLNEYSTTAAVRTSDAQDSTDRQRISLQNQFEIGSVLADKAEWQISYQDSQIRQRTFQTRVVSGVVRDRTRDSNYQEKLWNLNAKFDKLFETGIAQHHLIYGVDLKRLESSDLRKGREVVRATGAVVPQNPAAGDEIFPLSDFPDPTTFEHAVFAQDSIQIGRWTLLPGLRYDHYKMEPDVTQEYLNSQPISRNPANYSDHALSPKFGVTYQVDDAHSVYGQYAAGFRAPNPVNIFGEFINFGRNYQTIANTNLKAETSDSYELGVRGKYDVGSLGVALFYNRYDDFIEQVTLPSDPTGNGRMTFQYQNLDRVTIRGAEARGELFLGQLGLPEGTRLRGSIAYARGKDEGRGQPLNSVDPLKSVLGIGYDAPSGKFGGELAWTLVAAKDRIDDTQLANQYKPSGYGLLDLNGYWQVTEQFSVNAGLFNLTDKEYSQWGDVRGLTSTNTGLVRYTQPGRYGAINLIWEI
ncbi:TonB-dependent hemoglobin/transferrin/lactoferrin family receptor [Pseudomonas sp. PDM13]|uniref:TonB-dependent hemoglobin/transferrin/lactoferrin family receptor n=1 Tax=Pseudomonas sp. PDM13 TaxID=2769255 RepID=UPI0021DF4EC4|nr:TonB-dependent hemoglobin/transferrin/lactoferrin family receptor [Pseudomonas sp. PDM13]MCU9951332.1 TonB-dependent hemoglobin/transferrin/lactoferrin family receptor [Pseudomonas sp. PDM13]